MTAKLQNYEVSHSAYDYPVVQFIVSIDGRGIFSAISRAEADDFIERVNKYPETLAALKYARHTIERLKARVRKLREELKGGAE